ncbi:MAG: pyruvate kinase [Rickettsiales bacterium]|jgi:pyruvate kinase|nr:pyruvate kinase [Rickettsiales bacterium]
MIKRKESLNEYFRKTKIIATIGPATSSKEMLEKLIQAGVSIFRFNFSHDDISVQGPKADIARELSKKYGRHITFFADLQGPKLRIGTFKDGGADIVEGQDFIVDSNPEEGDSNRVYLPHPEILEALQVGERILIADGKLGLQVSEKIDSKTLKTKVIVGGRIKNKKGFNLPDTVLKSFCLTEKDKKDLEGIKAYGGFDIVALSFVQTPEDIIEARKIIGDDMYIISKFERPSVLLPENFEKMVELSDVVMLGRGDWGVEIGPEKVPAAQKKTIAMCAKMGKPVIVATHMLESMINIPFPTRSEATDVANAAFEGADCTMLSEETAMGSYPAESVAMMSKILCAAEQDEHYANYMDMYLDNLDYADDVSDAVYDAAVSVADNIDAKAIVCLTGSGHSAVMLSHLKPNAPVVAFIKDEHTACMLDFCAGVVPVVFDKNFIKQEYLEAYISNFLKDEKLAKAGDYIVVTFGRNTEEAQVLFKDGASKMMAIMQVS